MDGLVGGALHIVALLLVAGGALLLVLGPVAGLGHRPALAAVGGAALVVVDSVVDGLALGAVARGDSADQGDGEEAENENLKHEKHVYLEPTLSSQR